MEHQDQVDTGGAHQGLEQLRPRDAAHHPRGVHQQVARPDAVGEGSGRGDQRQTKAGRIQGAERLDLAHGPAAALPLGETERARNPKARESGVRSETVHRSPQGAERARQ